MGILIFVTLQFFFWSLDVFEIKMILFLDFNLCQHTRTKKHLDNILIRIFLWAHFTFFYFQDKFEKAVLLEKQICDSFTPRLITTFVVRED